MARRLTSDMYPSIMQNAYLKPSYKNPYYFITNHQDSYLTQDANARLESILEPCDINDGTISIPTMEIRCGDNSKYTPTQIYIDYLRVFTPLYMTYDQLEDINDSTQILEFPEYVCYEILNELVKLVLENIGDPRLQTNVPINQSISETSI